MNVDIKELLDSKRDLSEEEFNNKPELNYLVDGWGFKAIKGKIFIAGEWYILSQVALGSRLGDRYLPDPEYFTINFINYIKNATTKILFDKCPLNHSAIANMLIEINTDIIFNNCIDTNIDINKIQGYVFKKEIYLNNSNINFIDCTFKDNFKCENTNFDVNFSQNIFLKNFVFSAQQSHIINFECAQFHANTFFKSTQKIENANFYKAKFKDNASFERIQFGDIIANFSEVEFDKDVSFYRCTFNCETKFNSTVFSGIVKFTGAQFNDVVNLDKANFKDEVRFYRTKFDRAILTETNFKNKTDFTNAIFNGKSHFTNAIFSKEVKFNNILFKNNVYFRNTVFKDFVDFSETNFEKNANFYSANFKMPVNFSSIIFNGALNFVNAKTDFTYEELKKSIKDKSANNIDKFISITNDFRDGFRLMKHALNNKSNALDASLFHRLELYCKELELEFTLENAKAKDGGNSKEVKYNNEIKGAAKNKNFIEIFLDLITLKLYRNTSDHHTNLLRIINFIVLTIAVYGFSIFMYEKIILTCLISLPYDFVYSILLVVLCTILGVAYNRIPKYNIAWVYILLVGLVMLIIISAIITYMHAKYTAYIALFITLYLAIYFIAVIASRCNWIYLIYYSLFIAIFFIKPFLIAPFISIFTSEQAIESKFKKYTIRYNENGLDDMLLDANLTNTKKDNKLDFIVENRKTILDELDDDKKLSISFKENFKKLTDYNDDSKNTQDTSKKSYAEALNALKYDEIMQSTQKSANLLYSFIMLLVIYSLTKTARRNSVVPS